ncbi:MAG TPA: DUF1232 domain-containing protein [Herpetosiphonaceae bacterium]
MTILSQVKEWARRLKREVHALYLVSRDPRVPWHARGLALAVVGYALSPIDLIPDVIPVLGLLDDLILIPLGIALVLRLVPPAVMRECRERAAARAGERLPRSWIAGGLIICLWLALAGGAWWLLAAR